MSLKPLIVTIGFAAALAMSSAPPAAAQVVAEPDIVVTSPPQDYRTLSHPARIRHSHQVAETRPHIEIHPGRLLYRRCVDWYELQNRPSGQVLYPQMRCWWVRG
jgi:hypothetical protein